MIDLIITSKKLINVSIYLQKYIKYPVYYTYKNLQTCSSNVLGSSVYNSTKLFRSVRFSKCLFVFLLAPTVKIQPCLPSIEFQFSIPLKKCQEPESVTLNFRVQGHPEPRVIFIKNNAKLQPNENVDIRK